ncbi:hypothetical protein SHI21_07375 [Bacteriovorax sp. PP10]|uniref:Uncharacterized protein n=1 Tax=Bacteriovorax antarcticus TaxID=3088717 RepID=A0ABU5VSI6_9BACT|nr:hypothetical protein [Bacteriovorax sp. PP10]MEA9356014.1 hypothetical protein [Bacteriovorax sp. PP10]
MLNFKSSYIATISILAAISFTSVAKAEDKVTIIAKKQADSELTVLGFTIGKSKLEEVQTKFKSKEINHEADVASGIKFLCYKTSNGTTIAFESGDKGREDNVITGISINSSARPYRLAKQCEATSLIKTKLAINGVSLGMSSDLIKRVKGAPSSVSPENIVYQYEVKEDQTSIISSLNIRFDQNAVSSITAGKSESKYILQ